MIITKKSLSRRTVLRGMGVTLALPLLDAMVPALSALAKTAAKPPRRLGVIYVPNGVIIDRWTPAAEGTGFEFSQILQPLAPFRDRLLVVSNLNATAGGGVHSGASTSFLTGVGGTPGGTASISMDQVAAKELGQHTQFASLQLGLDGRENAGTCDAAGYPCSLSNTISWSSATTPLPIENNPRAVFERLVGDLGSTDSSARAARLQKDRSILDDVADKAGRLGRRVGPRDRAKLDEFLEAVRDIERRIQKAEEQSLELPLVEQPRGIPDTFEAHAKLMFDLQLLAYQTDLTRVITFMIGRELSTRTYPELGILEAHHPLSHHAFDPEKMQMNANVNRYHVTLFAHYLEKLQSIPEGDGSLLDNVTLMYGAGISESNAHDHSNVPIVLVNGSAKGGRHVKYAGEPLPNLHVTMLDKLGVPIERFANSTGPLKIETLSGV